MGGITLDIRNIQEFHLWQGIFSHITLGFFDFRSIV